MNSISGIAMPSFPMDGPALLARMIPEEEAETASSVVSGAAGFRAAVPARSATAPDGGTIAVLTGRIANAAQLCRRWNLPETDEFSLLFSLAAQEDSARWQELDGNFSCALWDDVRKRLILAVDGVGSRPLCWFRFREGIAFASCVGQLTALPESPREYDVEALRYYLSMQYLPAGRSVYSGICKLRPGEVLTFDLQTGTVRSQSFPLCRTLEEPEAVSFEEAASRLRKSLTASVERVLNGAGRASGIGVLLSGGIDSAIVAGIAAQLAGSSGITAFTIGTDDPRYDERATARETVRHLRARGGVVEHRELGFGPEDLERLRKLTARWGEPYADSSLLPMAKLLDGASERVETLLGGDGGDELFLGYDRYRAMLFSGFLDGWGNWLRPLFRAGAKVFPARGDRTLSGRIRRFGSFLGDKATRRYYALLDHSPELRGNALLGERFRKVPDLFAALGNTRPITSPEQAAQWDLYHYLSGDTFPKAAIASMGNRALHLTPLLDRQTAGLALALPPEYHLSGKQGKRLLRAAFADLIPGLCRLPKRGFGVPVAGYLRGPWREIAAEALFDSPLCADGWFQRKALEKIWRRHQSGTGDHSYLLWGAVPLGWFLEAESKKQTVKMIHA